MLYFVFEKMPRIQRNDTIWKVPHNILGILLSHPEGGKKDKKDNLTENVLYTQQSVRQLYCPAFDKCIALHRVAQARSAWCSSYVFFKFVWETKKRETRSSSENSRKSGIYLLSQKGNALPRQSMYGSQSRWGQRSVCSSLFIALKGRTKISQERNNGLQTDLHHRNQCSLQHSHSRF